MTIFEKRIDSDLVATSTKFKHRAWTQNLSNITALDHTIEDASPWFNRYNSA